MKIRSDNFNDQSPLPAEFAFGKPGSNDPCILSDNRNPHLHWSEVPANSRSFALLCIDPDVPSVGDDVNKSGKTVSTRLPRTEFVHWVMIDIPLECHELDAGSCADGVVAHGKREPDGPPGSRQGLNAYTGWFAGDTDMSGDYYGYDGPCPPWNDELLHHYHFTVYALDVAALAVAEDAPGRFRASDVRRAMEGHVLAEAVLIGTYTLNPAVKS